MGLKYPQSGSPGLAEMFARDDYMGSTPTDQIYIGPNKSSPTKAKGRLVVGNDVLNGVGGQEMLATQIQVNMNLPK